jgi:hypothetical protein
MEQRQAGDWDVGRASADGEMRTRVVRVGGKGVVVTAKIQRWDPEGKASTTTDEGRADQEPDSETTHRSSGTDIRTKGSAERAEVCSEVDRGEERCRQRLCAGSGGAVVVRQVMKGDVESQEIGPDNQSRPSQKFDNLAAEPGTKDTSHTAAQIPPPIRLYSHTSLLIGGVTISLPSDWPRGQGAFIASRAHGPSEKAQRKNSRFKGESLFG